LFFKKEAEMFSKNHVVFLRGKKVVLRPLNKQTDLEKVYKWINDPGIRYFVTGAFPQTIKQEEEWLDSVGKNKNSIVLAIEALGGEFIGTIGLHGIEWHNGVATTGVLIGEKRFWNKGYGTDAKMILLDYAFNELGLRKICSRVYSFNKRSLNYSLHCGYRIEGRLRGQILKNGKYYDIIELGLFKKDWLPHWRRYKREKTR
jgi:RimJ/RimL family protein N-acetyltransferase